MIIGIIIIGFLIIGLITYNCLNNKNYKETSEPNVSGSFE